MVMNFFKGFNFDTLLALISCITGIIALFLGTSAYKNYKKVKKSFNIKKKIGDEGEDNSQNAFGNIVNNYGYDTNTLSTLTNLNFSAALEKAYSLFEKQAENNLNKIIKETNKTIQDKKLELSGYTKIDWINIYFENAKNVSNNYMQKIWAKVLAKELDTPNSISFKTIDVLKNMSVEDFQLFEKMCSLVVDGGILNGEVYKKYGLSWIECIRLKELGLLSLENSIKTYTIPGKNILNLLCNEDYVIVIKNNADIAKDVKLPIFLITFVAQELLSMIGYNYNQDFLKDYINEMKKKIDNQISIELHKVVSVNGNKFEALHEDLMLAE